MPRALNAEQSATVQEIVKRILSGWTGYQLALKNNSAGSETSPLNEMLHNELWEMLCEHPDMEKFDIEDWLNDALNEGFHLILEDGSVEEMSSLLWECVRRVTQNRINEVSELLNKLPNASQMQNLAKQCDESSSDETDGDDEEMETEEAGPSTSKPRQPKYEEDADGWTTVLPRRPQ